MRTDADHQACVRDPAIELLPSHTATLTDEWCSRRRARRQLGLRIGEIRPAAKWFRRIGREFAALCVSDVDHQPATTSEPRPARPRSAKRHSRRSTPDTIPERLRRLGFGDSSIDTTDYHFRFLPESRTRPRRGEVALYVTEATLSGRTPLGRLMTVHEGRPAPARQRNCPIAARHTAGDLGNWGGRGAVRIPPPQAAT